MTHTHPQDEGIYLVEGSCSFYAGGESMLAEPGTFVSVPRHTEHAFLAAPGCRFLIFYLPAGFELIVAGLGVPALRNEAPAKGEFSLPPRELVNKLGADYGQVSVLGTPFADPPLREKMVTAPLAGAKARPYAAHARTAQSFWSNNILWSLLAGAETTDGSYTLFEEVCPKGAGAPPHVHLFSDEVFYMLEGEAEFFAGGLHETARAGALVFIPRGTVHAFKVRSDTARMLNLYTQAGFERLIEISGIPAPAWELPPRDLPTRDIPAARRAQLFAEIGMQVVAWPDPFG